MLTVADILSDETLRQEEFPVTRFKAFLAHAGVCPLPRRVAEAMAHGAMNGSLDEQELVARGEAVKVARQRAAALLHATPEEIAFVGPTSLGLSLVAAGLPWRKGDNVVIYFEDYPANVYPWMALAERGVQVRLMNLRELGRIRPADILGQVDEQTRLVALASCHFVAGWRLDLETIGKALHNRNILFCVDGIQTLGAFPTTVEHIDFLAADAHKWLLGPSAAGILYVRQAIQERLRPSLLGWHNVRCPNFVAQPRLVFQPDARRYEAGTMNVIGLLGLSAALELVLEVGVENIAAELLRKRALIVPAAQAKGWQVLHADAPPGNASGIVSLWRKDVSVAEVHDRLTKAGVVTSLRADRTGRQYIRLSPHFYNTDAELNRAIELL